MSCLDAVGSKTVQNREVWSKGYSFFWLDSKCLVLLREGG